MYAFNKISPQNGLNVISLLLIFIVVGLVAGLIAGMFGLGGGVVIVPALIYTFTGLAFPDVIMTHLAVGTSLGCIVITASISSWTHWQRKAVDIAILKSMVPGVFIGGWLGGVVASRLAGVELQMAFAGFLALVAVSMLTALAGSARRVPGRFGIGIAGLIIGGVSALFGVGGGSLTVPFLRYCNVVMARAVATSAALGFPIAVSGVCSYIYQGWGHSELPSYSLGFFYLPAFAGIVVCSAPAARIGAKLAHRLPAEKLQRAFALVLLIIALQLFLSGAGIV